jgi:plastocyanin
MKTSTSLKGLLSIIVFSLLSSALLAQSAQITVPAAASTNVRKGSTVSFTATRTGNFDGSGNYFFDWQSSPAADVSFNPATQSANNLSTSTSVATFTQTGTYSVSCSVHQSGTPIVTATKTVNVYDVSAGDDKLIGITSTTLIGSASGPSAVSYQWTKVSGGAATLTNAASPVASVSGMVAGSYVFRLTINGDAALAADVSITVITGTNLWATSSNGTQISSFSVANGAITSGPDNIFAPIGGSTAALGRTDSPNPSAGYFYWLPNSGTNGVVNVYAATAAGNNQTLVGTLDVNGASNNNLGFVRLGMGPDGKGYILAGDGTTLYLATFMSNGTSPVTITIVDNSVTLSGGTVATFQNGDVCVSGNNTIYALANDGSGVTQVFIGNANGSSTTLTKKWDLVDNTNTPFTGTVNGVAFDALGSLYLSTGIGLFYINQNTVNGPAGTVECVLASTISGLQDLASNVFPANSTLPVQLISFKGNLVNSNVNLSWESAAEDNISSYTVQRSYDGTSFTNAGTVAAAGRAHQYSFVDPIQGNPSKIYYRLKIAERVGYSYSSIVLVRPGEKTTSITASPNPFSNKVQFTINSSSDGNMGYSLIGLDGKQVRSGLNRVSKGSNTFFINDLQTLQQGIYMLRVQLNDEVTTIKLVKN